MFLTPIWVFGQLFWVCLIHNIPALLLAIIVWISWKYEIVGGVAFILAGLRAYDIIY